MSATRDQCDRVLAALAKAGPRGITQVDFEPPNVIDGGLPILRVAARIYDLKTDRGAVIRKNGWRNRCAVYVLESVRPGTAVTTAPEKASVDPGRVDHAAPGSATLFDLPASPQPAVFEDGWEAA